MRCCGSDGEVRGRSETEYKGYGDESVGWGWHGAVQSWKHGCIIVEKSREVQAKQKKAYKESRFIQIVHPSIHPAYALPSIPIHPSKEKQQIKRAK